MNYKTTFHWHKSGGIKSAFPVQYFTSIASAYLIEVIYKNKTQGSVAAELRSKWKI